jgi:PAS domain S-box-containing protein
MSPNLRADVLSKLLLIHETLNVLPDYSTIAAFLNRALSEIPGVNALHLFVEGSVYPVSQAFDALCHTDPAATSLSSQVIERSIGNKPVLFFPLRSARHIYGKLILSLDDTEAFLPYQAFVLNIANAVAASFETREHIRHLDENKISLEAKVAAGIASLKASQASLHISQERLQLATTVGKIGIWDYAVVDNRLIWDDCMFTLFGINETDFSGDYQAWLARVHPDDQARCDQEIQDALAGSKPFDTEFRVLHPNGNIRYIKALSQVFRDEQGQAIRVIGVNWDITAQKLAEIERDRLLSIIEDAPDFIATSDMQANLKYLNLAGARMVGLPDEVNLSGLQIKHVHPEWGSRKIFTEAIPTVLSQGFWQSENALLHADGHEIPVSQLLLVHRDDSGHPEFLSTIMRDITPQKVNEQALRQAKEAAEQANATKSEFLANISHEIRTPMNAIIGMTQLALNTPLNAQQQDYLHKILGSAQNLLSILNDILDFSKMEAKRLLISAEDFDLFELIGKLESLFHAQANEKSLDFSVQIVGDIPNILRGDALRLQQILTNLIANSLKFTEQGFIKLIISRVAKTNERISLRFCVEDSGIGISLEQQKLLFQPFNQADASITRRFGGTGLGLVICRELAQLMGSDIYLKSTLGSGSVFWFELELGTPQHASATTKHLLNQNKCLTTSLEQSAEISSIHAAEYNQTLAQLAELLKAHKLVPKELVAMLNFAPVAQTEIIKRLQIAIHSYNYSKALQLLEQLK